MIFAYSSIKPAIQSNEDFHPKTELLKQNMFNFVNHAIKSLNIET
jgi:hypothetical protein